MNEDETQVETMDETLSRLEAALGTIASHARAEPAPPAPLAAPLAAPPAGDRQAPGAPGADIAEALDDLIARLRAALASAPQPGPPETHQLVHQPAHRPPEPEAPAAAHPQAPAAPDAEPE